MHNAGLGIFTIEWDADCKASRHYVFDCCLLRIYFIVKRDLVFCFIVLGSTAIERGAQGDMGTVSRGATRLVPKVQEGGIKALEVRTLKINLHVILVARDFHSRF